MHECQVYPRAVEYRNTIAIIPKHRKRKLYGTLKKHVGEVMREVCRQRGLSWWKGT